MFQNTANIYDHNAILLTKTNIFPMVFVVWWCEGILVIINLMDQSHLLFGENFNLSVLDLSQNHLSGNFIPTYMETPCPTSLTKL
jgi:hypothetical protein